MSTAPVESGHVSLSTAKPGLRLQRYAPPMAVLALLIALGVAGASHFFGTADAVAPVATAPVAFELLPRDVAVASLAPLQRTIPLTGAIQPLNQTEIKAQQAGEIREVLVREGDPVRRGQILARLDTADLAAKLRDKLGALAVGKAQLAHAEKNLRSNEALLQSNFISQAAFDNLQNSFQVNEATLGSLRAQVEQARKAVADAVIRAPINGVVAERLAQPGLAVAVNSKLFTVQDLSLMNVEAPVPASDIPAVSVGQEARLRIEGFGEREFVGKVDRINPSTEPGTRSIMVHLLVANSDGQLRGGMFAQGTLGVSRTVSATVVPLTAVHRQGGRDLVFRIEAGILREQTVVVGMTDTTTGVVEIKSGLAAGDQVVIGHLANLRAGQPTRIAALAAAARP